MTNEIQCPKCGSTQIAAGKKGFSGKKAIAGAVLTGGIGIVAGTFGSNKIRITCLACGNVFKPGEGKYIPAAKDPVNQPSENDLRLNALIKNLETNTENSSGAQPKIFDPLDERILQLCKQGNKLLAVKLYSDETGVKITIANDYVDNLIKERAPSQGTSGGCFIATACYGNYNSPEVIVLRNYRDEKLLKTFFGKFFVHVYYRVSPFFASIISRSDFLKSATRKFLLQPILHWLT